jgi:hypothetical protein
MNAFRRPGFDSQQDLLSHFSFCAFFFSFSLYFSSFLIVSSLAVATQVSARSYVVFYGSDLLTELGNAIDGHCLFHFNIQLYLPCCGFEVWYYSNRILQKRLFVSCVSASCNNVISASEYRIDELF